LEEWGAATFQGQTVELQVGNDAILVGGFNPFDKYESNWIISPSMGENKKYLKPPPSIIFPLYFSIVN